MHIWRIETVDGIGPFHYWKQGLGLPLTHSRYFPTPEMDTHEHGDLWRWIFDGTRWCDYNPHREHGSATLVCGMLTEESLRECFEATGDGDTQAFTVTCYEVPPLYCILLKSQILFDRRFATIVTRVRY